MLAASAGRAGFGMIFSENRLPLFGIMPQRPDAYSQSKADAVFSIADMTVR
jgi:hypothetical protein